MELCQIRRSGIHRRFGSGRCGWSWSISTGIRRSGLRYTEREGLGAEDVKTLALQMRRGKEATLERAHAAMRGEAQASRPREPISEAVRHEVWRRDQGKYVDCDSRENLELDHIIPWSEGGSNTVRNLELRCESCNRTKSARI